MLAVSQLQARDLAGDHAAAGVGEERRHPVPVDVGEGELRARMGAFLAQDQPRPFRPRRQVDHAGGLGDPGAVAQPLVFDRRVPALAGIRSTMAWMRSSTGNPKENSTLPCRRPRRTGAWPRRSRSGPAPAASRVHPAAAGRALAATPAPSKSRPATTPSPKPTHCPATSAAPSTASTAVQMRTKLSQLGSSAPSRGQWRCYCPRCRPAAGRPAPPHPRPPAGPKRPAAGGIRMSSSRWPPRSVPVLWAMLIVASKSIRSSPPRSGAAPVSQARSRAAARAARTRARCGASIRSSGRSARSRLTSLAEVVPADLFTARTRSSPLGTAGAPRGA
jgi:hypothetical protein